MHISILTLFPSWFAGPLGESVIGRAQQQGLLKIDAVDFRNWTSDKHQSVDDAPYGGGGGMVIRPEPIAMALDVVAGSPGTPDRAHVIFTSPRGRKFDQRCAMELARKPRLAIICGHYEALDQRVIDSRVDEEISIGDFVMTGGEIAAMAMVDAIARMIPGVLGNDNSAPRDSFMNGLLEGPHYTRPEVWEGVPVPPVLLSGNHGAIEAWREECSLALTRQRRPDLLRQLILSPEAMRRIVRRGRPFVIFREGTAGREILFASQGVRELPDPGTAVARLRRIETMVPGTFHAEVKEAFAPSPELDRQRLREDVTAELAKPDHELTPFFRQLERILGAPT